MTNRTFIIIAISTILGLSSLPIFAAQQRPITLTLKDSILLAVRKNPDIESAELTRITQKYALVIAKHNFEPQYSLKGSLDYDYSKADGVKTYSHTSDIKPSVTLNGAYGTKFSVSGDSPRDRYNYNPSMTFTVEQPLLRGFGKAVVEQVLNDAIDDVSINRLNFKKTAIQTIDQVITDYFALLKADAQLQSDNITLKDYEKTLKNDLVQIAAGNKAANEKIQDKANIATQRATIRQDLNSLQQSRYTLLNIIGLSDDANIKLPKKINFDHLIVRLIGGKRLPPLGISHQLAIANNPTYQTEGIALRKLRRALLVARDGQRWQLDLTASEKVGGGSGGGGNGGLNSLTNHRNHTESVGLELTIPIDDVSAKQSVINARISLEEAEINYQNERRQLKIETTKDRNSVINDKEQLKLSKEALKMQQATLRVTRLKAEAGKVSSFELNTQQEKLNTNQQSVINSTITYLNDLEAFDDRLGTTLDLWGIKIRD